MYSGLCSQPVHLCSLKNMSQLQIRRNDRECWDIKTSCGYLVEIPHWSNSNKYYDILLYIGMWRTASKLSLLLLLIWSYGILLWPIQIRLCEWAESSKSLPGTHLNVHICISWFYIFHRYQNRSQRAQGCRGSSYDSNRWLLNQHRTIIVYSWLTVDDSILSLDLSYFFISRQHSPWNLLSSNLQCIANCIVG